MTSILFVFSSLFLAVGLSFAIRPLALFLLTWIDRSLRHTVKGVPSPLANGQSVVFTLSQKPRFTIVTGPVMAAAIAVTVVSIPVQQVPTLLVCDGWHG